MHIIFFTVALENVDCIELKIFIVLTVHCCVNNMAKGCTQSKKY